MKSLIVSLLAFLCLVSCGGNADSGKAVPRPEAWHRIEMLPENYDTLDAAPGLHFLYNSSAVLKEQGNENGTRKVDIVYPAYGNATLYCTFTQVPDTMARNRVIDNRYERIILNAGRGGDTDVYNLSNHHWNSELFVTRAGAVTPVQFLFYNDRIVGSGSLYVNVSANYAPDSIAPVVDGVARDLRHALLGL